MTRFLSAALAILLSATTTVSAFSINSHHRQSVFRSTSTTTYATEDTDFDAPIPANPMSGTAVLGKDIAQAVRVVSSDVALNPYLPKGRIFSLTKMASSRTSDYLRLSLIVAPPTKYFIS